MSRQLCAARAPSKVRSNLLLWQEPLRGEAAITSCPQRKSSAHRLKTSCRAPRTTVSSLSRMDSMGQCSAACRPRGTQTELAPSARLISRPSTGPWLSHLFTATRSKILRMRPTIESRISPRSRTSRIRLTTGSRPRELRLPLWFSSQFNRPAVTITLRASSLMSCAR